ncbi:MAG TPA: hypothetical protein VFV05_24065 [Methylomirabilota bacterium]|nr:hypothetical protein [Methylomirabilota bacterium]
MAKNGFKVFDSDMHVLEPVDLWERYIDPAFRNRAPRGSTHTPMDVGVVVDGQNAFRLSAAIAKVSFKGGLGAVELGGDGCFVFSTDYPHCARLYGVPA